MPKNILITGGAGFIGHQVVSEILKRTDWSITLVDRLDHSGNLNRLAEIGAVNNSRVKFVFHDLRAPANDYVATWFGHPDYVVHLAAATHVDRSIVDPLSFVMDNVVATCNLLDLVRKIGCEKMIHFSTDEVFGPAPIGVKYAEWDRYKSGNPYAATKAGAEELAVAYHNTFKLPVMITHTMNVIGIRQAPEKYVPMCIAKIGAEQVVTIHSDKSKTRAGMRHYISTVDVADAVLFLLKNGTAGEKYNIVGAEEIDNLRMAQIIADLMDMPLRYEMVDFHSSRPGHDLRYALDGTKMKEMGWSPMSDITQTLSWVVDWTLRNPQWLKQLPPIRDVKEARA